MLYSKKEVISIEEIHNKIRNEVEKIRSKLKQQKGIDLIEEKEINYGIIYYFKKGYSIEKCNIYYSPKKKNFSFVPAKKSIVEIIQEVEDVFNQRDLVDRKTLNQKIHLEELKHYYAYIEPFKNAYIDFSEFKDLICQYSKSEKDVQLCNLYPQDFNILEKAYFRIIEEE